MKPFLTLIFLFLFLGTAGAGSSPADPADTNGVETVFTGPIRLFQKTLSAADGDRCPMTPSCSAYAMESTRRHGAIMGWIMACDRLLRCGRDELKDCPPKATPNGIRCPDPVENNDFWWK